MKSILLYASDDSSIEARFQTALDVTRAFDAHLTCLQATPVELLVSGDPYAGIFVTTELLDVVRQQETSHRAKLEQRLRNEAVRWDWLAFGQDPEFAIIEQSGLADLVILGLPHENGPARARSLIANIAVSVRSPVLAVPENQRSFDCSGTAVVAWNGSMESAHALRFALPLLAKSAAVRIVTVADDRQQLPAAAAAEYLSRHGIGSELCDLQRGNGRISNALIDGAKALGGAYLVAGAYGHTRFREAVLGGVTRELIEAAAIPLLLTH